MNEQRSGPQGRPMGNMVSGMGLGGGMDSQDRNSQMARRGGGSHLGSTMRMNISVETLPHRLVQPKSRKGDTGDRHMAGRDLPSMSPETSYGGRGGREHWGDMHGGRTGGPSMGQSSARGRSQANYGYGSRQSANSSRGYDFGYGGNNGGGGGGRDGQYSDRSRRDSYGGYAMRSSQSDSMQRRMGSPSQGKVQDFLGAMPSMSLCVFDVHSNMEWNPHTNGLRHAENRKHPQMYPDWDPGMAQNTSGGGGHHMDTPNLFVGMLGLIPMSPGRSSGGMPSSWGGGPSSGLSNKGLPQEQLVLNKEGMRVVNLVGFRRGYGFLGELLALAKPFGDVVKHLVLDLRPEAFLQFASEEEAKAMARFYNSNVMATVCGKPVRIRHSQTYPTIQTSPRFGASKVVYVSQLPSTKYKEEDVLQLVESFGKVRKYLFNRIRRECFIEMEEAEDAKRLSDFYGENPPKIQNKQIGVCISRKYNQLTFGGHERPMQDGVKRPAKRESSSTSSTSSKTTEEPPFKKPKEEKVPEGEKEDDVDEEEVEKIETKERPDTQKTAEVKCEEGEVKVSAGAAGKASQAESPAPEPQPPAEAKPPSASLPLDPFDPETPLGVEHVKMGYYCRVCFFFYYNENTAKKVHCSSKAHYDKLKNHLEKEQAKAQNPKKGRK